MNSFNLPLYGTINFQENKNLNVRLYENKDNEIKLELLDRIDELGFGGYTLTGKFSGTGYINYITFFNCYKMEHIDKPEIEFSGYISFEDFLNKNNEKYIDLETPRKSVNFTINNLEKWIYPHLDICKDYNWSYLDKDKKQIQDKNDASFFQMKLLNNKNHYEFILDGEKIILSIINEVENFAIHYPKIEIYPYTYIKLEAENEHTIKFFIPIILKLRNLFSLFINQFANISSVYEFVYCTYRIDYELLNENYDKNDLLLQCYNINYKNIKDCLSDIIQKWFDIYEKYKLIINSVCNYEHPKSITDAINKNAQLLETYGNIINKGKNSRNDIITAIDQIKSENFNKLFHIQKDQDDWVTHAFDLRKLAKDKKTTKQCFGNQIMNLRNHFIHPYKNGKLKSPQEDFIDDIFIQNENIKNKSIKILTNHLANSLIVLLLQELKIDDYYENFNS